MSENEKEIDLILLIKLFWKEKKTIIKWGFIASCIGVIVAISIPKTYISGALIIPEMKSSSARGGGSLGQLASLAGVDLNSVETVGLTEKAYPFIVSSRAFAMEFANIPIILEDGQSVSYMNYLLEECKSPWWNVVLSAPVKALGWIINLFKDTEEEDNASAIDLRNPTKKHDQYIDTFRKLVGVDLDVKEMTINITVEAQSPEISLQIADSAVTKLKKYVSEYRTSKTRNELQSNIKMLEEAKHNYYNADSIYAKASDVNSKLSTRLARTSLEKLQNEKDLTFTIYRQIASQVEMSRVKVNEETPIFTMVETPIAPIKAAAPNKPLIVIALAFLGGFAALVRIFIKNMKNIIG